MNWTLFFQLVLLLILSGIIGLLLVLARTTNQEVRRRQEVRELTEAIRLTVEYVGLETLPPRPGWSWFEALQRYAPEDARRFELESRRRT